MTYAKPVPTFADIETEFMERVRTLVGCTAAAVDARGKPRSRVWHPIWEGNTGRIATNRNTLKTRHLARNPPPLALLPRPQRPVETRLRRLPGPEWDDTAEGKRRAWEMYVRAPEPVGYDPSRIWGTVANPEFGVLMLRPWRVELVDRPGQSRVWRA